MVIIVMGVAGSGKSTVGQQLASSLGWSFAEGDHFHSVRNVEQMSRGLALTDDDRKPWLAALRGHIASALARRQHLVVSCSALKHSYRQALNVDPAQVRFVYLKGDPAVIEQRLRARQGHFMPASLLASQFALLEETADALVMDVASSPEVIVQQIRDALKL